MRTKQLTGVVLASLLALALYGAGCGSDSSTDTNPADASLDVATDGPIDFSSALANPDSGYNGGTVSDGGIVGCVPAAIDGGVAPQCANCIDDDGDGLVDWLDPECTGPLDNDEGSFATGISGDNMDACKQDCFFDGNSGQGDDGCNWDLRCDPADPGGGPGGKCPYDPNQHNCPGPQSQYCIDHCIQYTPNGCDCFGCCEVPRPDGGTATVFLSSTCSAATLDDPTKCRACTIQTSCFNSCDTCELCVGKTTLPASCTSGTQSCSSGAACGQPGQAACPTGTFCLTGCCAPVPVTPK